MKRLKRFHISVGNTTAQVRQNKSRRKISVSYCEIFSNGELSGMLQFASHLYLEKCMGLRKVIVNKKSFNGLKSIYIHKCSCYFTPLEEGSGQFDPLPNLEYLSLEYVHNLKSVSDFSQFLGLRLRQLVVYICHSLTCLFNVDDAFALPKHLEDVSIVSNW
ncbi:hypothetical protein RDI58_019285 [Solanum bulbocastanum]|uniref:Uncharacterized protein n=1 Tax=Solanum bulbocastanum TaxID=147425 RepID=A0AAN8T7Y6_SOLBU